MACALGVEQDCNECRMCESGKGGKKMTNFERIKGMSVEELAEVFEDKVSSFDCDVCSSKYAEMDICGERSCHKFAVKCLKEWLESECDAEC